MTKCSVSNPATSISTAQSTHFSSTFLFSAFKATISAVEIISFIMFKSFHNAACIWYKHHYIFNLSISTIISRKEYTSKDLLIIQNPVVYSFCFSYKAKDTISHLQTIEFKYNKEPLSKSIQKRYCL